MPQQPLPAPPAPPGPFIVRVQTPPPPGDIAPIVTVSGQAQFRIPQTPAEMAILMAQRAQISSQIENVRSQRASIARQYERSSGASRTGLEQQLQSIDGRLLQLQEDLEASGRALYQSRTGLPSTGVPQFFNLNPGQITGISIVFILFVLGPLAASLGRLMWRRSTKPTLPPGWYDAAQRLERVEQAVDTIAVEVERVSEGQRFMTKLMTQNTAGGANAGGAAGGGASALNGGQPLPALGAGSPEPAVLQNQRDEVRVRRS